MFSVSKTSGPKFTGQVVSQGMMMLNCGFATFPVERCVSWTGFLKSGWSPCHLSGSWYHRVLAQGRVTCGVWGCLQLPGCVHALINN